MLHALERDPNDRWQTAGDFRDALEHLRLRLGLSASNRDVASWMEWAFSLDEPTTGTVRRGRDTATFSAISETHPGNVYSPITRSSSYTGKLPSPADVVALPGLPSMGKGGREDEEAADMAWGSLEEEAGANVPEALDEIPDVSGKALLPSLGRPAVASGTLMASSGGRATGFGAGVIQAHRQSNARKLMAGAVLLALAGGVVAFVALRPGPEPAAVAPSPVVTTAVLKFAVEPADAVIDVQGHGRHEGAVRLEVEAPATYHVEIKRDGYKSYVAEIELEPSELRTMQVALQAGGSNQASLVVRSTPSEQQVLLDGAPLAQRTPVNLEVPPGAHLLTIVDPTGKEALAPRVPGFGQHAVRVPPRAAGARGAARAAIR